MSPLTERFEMRLEEDTVRSIDIWRANQEGLPSRAEAIRRLIERALERENAPERKTLKFSRAELLITHLLCDLLKNPKDRELDPAFIQSALLGGHNWALEWDLGGVFPDREDNAATVSEVMNVLDMWHFVETGYAELDAKAKASVEKEVGSLGKNPKFTGFDGNNESQHMHIARFLIEKMGRFERFKGRDLNSHWPVLGAYQRMLVVFEPKRAGLVGRGLSASEIIELLNAGFPPKRKN